MPAGPSSLFAATFHVRGMLKKNRPGHARSSIKVAWLSALLKSGYVPMTTRQTKPGVFKTAPVNPYDFAEMVHEIQAHLMFLKGIGCRDDLIPGRAFEIIDRMMSGPGTAGFSHPDIKRVCKKCPLYRVNGRPVFGTGPDHAGVMFVGAVPEAGDEESKRLYSGPLGELLSRIIRAMKLDPDSVYITTALKCRPRDGHLPDKLTGRFCRPHLHGEIERIRPGLIVVFGAYPAAILLKTSEPLVRLRGRFHDFSGIPVMPTHDLQHIIENPSVKRAVWNDMKQVMARLESASIIH